MRQAPDSDSTERTTHTIPARAMPAFADESLVDYLLRALEECRASGRPLACRFSDVHFTISPTMEPAQVVSAWHTAYCGKRETA